MIGEFASSDAGFVAFLRTRQIRYLRIEVNPTDPTIADFIFKQSPEIFECLVEWGSNGEGCFVDARVYDKMRHDTIRKARQLVKKSA